MPPSRSRLRRIVTVLALSAIATTLLLAVQQPASAGVRRIVSSVKGSDGKTYVATNHLVTAHLATRPHDPRREWLLVWAGDADQTGPPQTNAGAADPDFLAVVDATKGSRTYGKVVNTVTLTPLARNEPHHMQYVWHRGDRIYAGSMFADTVYVLDASRLPVLRLVGVNLAVDTPCGSVPDAFATLSDGTAYASYLGGPDVAGPCRYTNGEVRLGNGFAGSPGEIVRLGRDGRTIAEIPSATASGEDPAFCHNIPTLEPATCANPHGIQVREDLDRLIVSDFAEVRNYLDPDAVQLDEFLLRDTVRIFDISNRNDPRLLSVSRMPEGPRVDELPALSEPRMVMETSVTNRPWHRGAFASTMAGGAIYYTPDITVAHPQWREVFDDTTAFKAFDQTGLLSGSNDGGSWLAVSPDDRFLFHTVMGSDPRLPQDVNTGLIYVLDIRKLLAAGRHTSCHIDTVAEVSQGGAERDCPALVSVLPLKGGVGGPQGRVPVGPHWAAMDNFRLGWDGRYHETSTIRRLATSNYFVSQGGIDGDHKVCMTSVSPAGSLSLDTSFRDEYGGGPCLDFNRDRWPHGSTGGARPHGVLFAVADADIR
jgi:hypothetical protein